MDGRSVPRDVAGAPDATHDFDVQLADGRTIALEVTSATDEDVQGLHAAAMTAQHTTSALASDWLVGGGQASDGPQVRIRELIDGIIPVLAAYERHGVSDIDTRVPPRSNLRAPGTPQDVIEATQQQFELGAVVTHRLGPRHSSEAQVFISIHGGVAANANQVDGLVGAVARRKADKLAVARADERHLFVWLSATHSDAELAVFSGRPPTAAPSLPAGIDALWLATRLRDGYAERLWRMRPPGGWEVLEPPQPPHP